MKKLLTIFFVLFGLAAAAQVYTPMSAAGYQYKRVMADSTLHIPSFCGVPFLRDAVIKKSAIAADTCNHLLYLYDPKLLTWNVISGGGGGGGATTKFYDSTSLNYNGTKYIFFNGEVPVDSVSVTGSVNLGTTNLLQTGNYRTYNGNNGVLNFRNLKEFYVTDSTGVAGFSADKTLTRIYNQNPAGSLQIAAPTINVPTLPQDDALTKILVRDNTVLGRLYWRDAGSITAAETDPLFNTKFAAKSTSDLSEGSNLYYTTARGRSAISLVTAGSTGPASYDAVTGVINVPEYSGGIVAETDPLSVHISDSAAMLSNYLSKAFAAATYATIANLNLKQDIITTSSQTQTASGSTAFTFANVPASYNDYNIFRNGVKNLSTSDYTTSGNIVTIPSVITGDEISFERKK